MERARVRSDCRNRSAGVRRLVACDADAARTWPSPSLTRLTSDVGSTDDPAISLDGKFLAYASDRGGNDGTWISGSSRSQTAPPVRLPRTPLTKSSHRSRPMEAGSRSIEPAGGRLYIIPTLGGEERLLAARGFSPRFSPDGHWIAYRVADRPAARSRWPRPPEGRPSLLPAAFTGPRRRSGPPTADICCSGGSATATRRGHDVDW